MGTPIRSASVGSRIAHAGLGLLSVCTGSLVYAAAGLLKNRPATTHWASLDLLGQLDPTIDMALHLVGRLASPSRSAEVRRFIEYDPTPPH